MMPRQSKAAKKGGDLSQWKLLASRLCSLGAFLAAGYLAWTSLNGGAVPGCGPSSSCQDLLASRWAYGFGLPVSLLACLIYGIFFGATFGLTTEGQALRRRRVWAVLVSCSFLMILAAIWFVLLQLFVVKKVCPFCMTAHGFAMLAAGILLSSAPIRYGSAKVWRAQKEVFIEPGLVKKIAFASAFGLALLIAAQTLLQPRTYLVRSMRAGTSASPQSKVVRLFSIYDGKFQLNLHEEPLIGTPTAPQVMVSLFDYTCRHCRTTHGYLKEAHQVFGDQLAIVNLPMPLDGACNSAVRRTSPDHTNACEYALIGLAVWRADRKASEQFDDWMFAPPVPPDPAEARQYAAKLVGPEPFAKALQEEWINLKVKRNVAIYQTSYLQDRRGMMPQLLIGNAFVAGPLNQSSDLFRLLFEHLGLTTIR